MTQAESLKHPALLGVHKLIEAQYMDMREHIKEQSQPLLLVQVLILAVQVISLPLSSVHLADTPEVSIAGLLLRNFKQAKYNKETSYLLYYRPSIW